ncbi:hypothetical protein APB26_32105 [Pseudomonas aeruginosa]|uniref:hypothetical protein n=1 Tax=Pseudomonas aeruginosa TaxID=287 RepID=UPI00071BC06B|nr:hypothetical protein [Pseudomonas aeruginosa]KSQ21629.1 hypothetical protein APB26_32105 [Pseudomonas aeruginosa]RPV61298.1 hypothetical protein IPC838_18435 [Pseudomonas aeruginosa]
MQKIHVFALTSQADIDTVANGVLPAGYRTWEFETQAEVDAYVTASKVMREEGIKIHSVNMDGERTVYEVSINGGAAIARERAFSSHLEGRAFRLGLRDFAGRDAWKAITEADSDEFAQLQSLVEAREARLAAAAAASMPTIVIYKTADQITRVVATQGVRVIVLDADDNSLEEEATRTLLIGDQELVVSDLIVTGKVGESPYGEQGVDAVFVREVVKCIEGLPAGCNASFNKPGQHAEPFPYLKSVPVKHWEEYEDDKAPLTHQIDIDDQRLTNGQLYVTVGSQEGQIDNLLSVTAEVNTSPQNEADKLPCLHVHFNEDALAFTAFKVFDKILLRPEEGVVLTKVHGPQGPMYIVE